jgi:hypothetical protein
MAAMLIVLTAVFLLARSRSPTTNTHYPPPAATGAIGLVLKEASSTGNECL